MSNNHLVIMAGGVGSRFWPMSRPENPKQFIDILNIGRTMLQLTVDRFGSGFKPANTWVVTSEKYAQKVREQLPMVPQENILLEPCMRNTAPCIGYVAWKILKRDPDATLVVSAADHFVADTAEFRRIINTGLNAVRGTASVLTLGMTPTRPETGYGYIQAGAPQGGTDGICAVKAFKEKPDLQTAQHYLSEGGYYWNAGIFLWDARTVEAALRKFEPEMAGLFDQMAQSFYTGREQQTVAEIFPKCKNISVDYAIMEPMGGKSVELRGMEAGVFVLPSDFGWTDLGTWGSLYLQLEKDGNGNAVVGKNVALIDSKNCIVRTSGGIKIVLQGLENFIVAEDNGTLLVCRKDCEQQIKSFSEAIKD